VGFTPFGLAAGAQVIVTFLGAHYTGVAGRQLPKAGITVTLTEALAGASVTMDTPNHALEIDLNRAANQLIKWQPGITDLEVIDDW
jgi:hypothetical protein